MGNIEQTKKNIPWEYLLTANLILKGIASIKEDYSKLPIAQMGTSEILKPYECNLFVSRKLSELGEWAEYAAPIYSSDINKSWGPPGTEGNKEEIEAACSKLINAMKALYDWELSIAKVIPHGEWAVVFNKLKNSSMGFINDIETFFSEFQELILDPHSKGNYMLTFEFELPQQLKGIDKDIRRAQKKSVPKSEWDDLWLDVFKKLIGV